MPNPHTYSGIKSETVTRRPDGSIEMVDAADWYVEQSVQGHNPTVRSPQTLVQPLGNAGRQPAPEPEPTEVLEPDEKLEQAMTKDLSKRNVRGRSKKK